jgi:signal transduction histidine kinase
MPEGPVSAQVYQRLFGQMRMPLILTDLAFSRFLDVNETAARWIGLSSKEIFKLTPKQFFPEIQAGQSFHLPFQSNLKTETETHNVIVYPSVLDDYLAFAWVILPSHADIAAENQRLQTISQRKSELIANLSHELKTPLTAILGWPEILLDLDDLPERVHQAASSIEKEGKLLLELMEDLMDLSKVESGQLRLDIRPEVLNDVICNSLEIVREKANAKEQCLELELPQTELVVAMDPLRVTQVLLNLLSNAIKFTPQHGKIRLTVEAFPEEVKISIHDNGIGLEANSQALVFERFMRAPEAQAIDGTGIGLSLVQKFVELQGGQVGVESKPGVGSTFWFSLPLNQTLLDADSDKD